MSSHPKNMSTIYFTNDYKVSLFTPFTSRTECCKDTNSTTYFTNYSFKVIDQFKQLCPSEQYDKVLKIINYIQSFYSVSSHRVFDDVNDMIQEANLSQMCKEFLQEYLNLYITLVLNKYS